jgi:hypothetical protein
MGGFIISKYQVHNVIFFRSELIFVTVVAVVAVVVIIAVVAVIVVVAVVAVVFFFFFLMQHSLSGAQGRRNESDR